MILAGHTLATPDTDLLGALELFRDAGLDAAEVIWQSGYRAGLSEAASQTDLSALDHRARELGVGICALTPYMTALNSLDPAERERDINRFERCIADAARLEAPIVRVYAGDYRPGAEGREAHWHCLVDSLRELAPLAAASGVTLAVENHFNTMTVSARETAALIAACGAPDGLGVLYDQANLAFSHDEGYEQAIALQAQLIRHVHIKDLVFVDRAAPVVASSVSRVDPDKRAVRSRVVGEGELDWPAIFTTLIAAEYTGAMSLEYEYRWHPQDLPPPADGLRRSAEFVRAALAEVAV